MKPTISILLTATLLISSPARAAMVSYDVANISGSTWRYTYALTNDSLPSGLSELTIFFGVGEYVSLALTASPNGWDSLVVQPDPAIPDAGFLDSLVTGSPLGLFATAGGFSVDFTWLGNGTPGAQQFSIVDPNSFATLQSGSTTPAAVPLPATVCLLLGGLSGLSLFGRRHS